MGNVSSKAQLPLSPRLVYLFDGSALVVRLSAAGRHPASASHAEPLHDETVSAVSKVVWLCG